MPTTAIKDLTPALGAFGTISYGTYTFNAVKNVKLSAEPVYDEADRMVTHVQYVLNARLCLVAGTLSGGTPPVPVPGSCDINMAAMQDVLLEAGRRLVIQGIGFDSPVDTSIFGAHPDIIWGAKPRGLEMVPSGGEQSWMFDWECEFCISRCMEPYSPGSPDMLMAWNYDWTAAQDEQGLMTRTISGYLQVVAVRGADGTAAASQVLFNVDNQWDKLTCPVPTDFKRTQNVRTITKAKNRIDFAIVDTQLDGFAFPPGIIDCDVEWEFSTMTQGSIAAHGIGSYHATLAGSLTTAVGVPTHRAGEAFFEILQQKYGELQAACLPGVSGSSVPIPMTFKAGRSLFTRTSRFSMTFMFASDIDTLLSKGGLWSPVVNSDYATWFDSMTAVGIFTNRGTTAMKFNPGEDKLLDVCIAVPGVNAGGDVEVAPAINETDEADQFTLDGLTPANNYLAYTVQARPVKDENFVVHRYAQSYTPGQTVYQDHVTQYQGAPDQYLVLEGFAARFNALPEMPQVVTVGGQAVELLEKRPVADVDPIALIFGNTLYRAAWSNLYRIKGAITTIGQADIDIPLTSESALDPLLGQAGQE